MKLEEISQIKITSDESAVNKYLAEGYRILKMISAKVTTNEGEFISPCFILGLQKKI